MATMRAVQVSSPGGPLQVVQREVPEPRPGTVRLRVEACGICHSDVFTKEGTWPGLQYPRVPGHEVAGVIDAVGERVPQFKVGQRAGVGWHGGHCGHCDPCRRGDFMMCVQALITGISYDGGYADYMIVPSEAVVRIPEEIPAVQAAPLMCAGVTTYHTLRNSGARAGDLVAILGIGGLGHLGLQYAARMGFRTVAVARGADKERLARELGAAHFIDNQASDPAAELQRLGGAKVILATAPNSKAMEATIDGLGVDGKLLIVGVATDAVAVSPPALITRRRSLAGALAGSSIYTEDTLAFSALAGVRSFNETYPLERAAEAYDRMTSGKARFRVVLKT